LTLQLKIQDKRLILYLASFADFSLKITLFHLKPETSAKLSILEHYWLEAR